MAQRIERIDSIPLTTHWLKEMRVHEIIDLIYNPHKNWTGITFGQPAVLKELVPSPPVTLQDISLEPRTCDKTEEERVIGKGFEVTKHKFVSRRELAVKNEKFAVLVPGNPKMKTASQQRS